MKTQNTLHLAGLLLLLSCAALLGPAASVEAQEVHALLIIQGSDRNIRPSLEKNESHLKELMGLVSAHCPVQLTVLKSEDESTVTTMSLTDGKASDIQETEQEGPITSGQVEEWLNAVDTKPNDTVLIYYTGHAGTTNSGSHRLLFGDVKVGMADDTFTLRADDTFARAELSSSLKKKPARLKMLITDTDGGMEDESQRLEFDTDTDGGMEDESQRLEFDWSQRLEFDWEMDAFGSRWTNNPTLKHLFLQHKGTLDINAASPGEDAWGGSKDGGVFTYTLIESVLFGPDANEDGFISWTEVFGLTQKLTQERLAELHSKGLVPVGSEQATLTPVAYSLPEPVPEP